MIDDLVVPASDSIGVRLLKRMGWKPGQGIGPRVSKRQRHPNADPFSDDDTPANVTFAPIDSAVIVFANKSNHFGLGFDPHKDAPEFDVSVNMQSGKV
jgi:G patch domain-containing protein 1